MSSPAAGTPTISSHFVSTITLPNATPLSGVPTRVSLFIPHLPLPTRTPHPTLSLQPAQPPAPTAGSNPTLSLVPVFSDQLAAGWSVAASWSVELDLQSTGYVRQGEFAIAATPTDDYGALLFAVMPNSPFSYPYTNTLGVRFWLNGGTEAIYPGDLAVTVLGSNAYTYWVQNDDSVDFGDDEPAFSETRLYHLNINRPLPAGSWVEITVWLDDLQFDPDYTYFTGLYIKNDADFWQTFYIDQVALIILEPEG